MTDQQDTMSDRGRRVEEPHARSSLLKPPQIDVHSGGDIRSNVSESDAHGLRKQCDAATTNTNSGEMHQSDDGFNGKLRKLSLPHHLVDILKRRRASEPHHNHQINQHHHHQQHQHQQHHLHGHSSQGLNIELTKPSLDLFPADHDRAFSHVAVAQTETQTDPSLHVYVSRDVYTQEDIDEMFDGEKESPSCCEQIKSYVKCTPARCCNSLFYFLPILGVLKTYKFKKYILADFISGITVACMHFPQGLAYGILASLSPIQGLYVSFFPILFYMIFGTSQHMSLGADAVIAIITAETVDTELQDDFLATRVLNDTSGNMTISAEDILAYKVGIAAGTTMLCGLILITMGIFRLGFLASYLSKSFIGGFTTAASFHIFSSQIPKALNIQIPLFKGMGKLVYMYIAIAKNIADTNLYSVLVMAVCAIFMLFIKDYINVRFREKLKMPIPVDLIIIIIATIISRFANLDKVGIEVVGSIPSGIPIPSLPNMSRFPQIFSNSFQMALLIFFLTIAMAKLCAEKHEYEINDNQELMSYGMLNLCCSFFPCFPATTSPPRSMILSYMGSKTTLSGLFTVIVMLLVLLVLGQCFTTLPVPALAAMIFVSVKPLLMQVRCLPKLFRVSRYDFIIWVTACGTGILLDLPYGLLCGIAISFVMVVIQSQKSDMGTLLQTDRDKLFLTNKKGYTEMGHPETEGIKIFCMNSALYFATTDRFRRNLYNLTVNPLLIPHPSSSDYSKQMESEASKEDSNPNLNNDKGTEIEKLNNGKGVEIAAPTKMRKLNKSSEIATSTEKIALEVDADDNESQPKGTCKVIIIECSRMNYIDIQGINTLSVVFEEYRRVDITVFLAGCPPFMWKCLKKSEFFDVVSKERVFFQLRDAFQAAKLLIRDSV